MRIDPGLRRRAVRRGGFIFLFGTRSRVANEGTSAPAVCPRCHQRADFQGRSVRSWFTLFFIPVFPIGAKHVFSQCGNCGAQLRAMPQDVARASGANQQQQMQQAIMLYNSLRNSPANSITLNNLMLLYLELGEYDQAVSAANEFSPALHASEQCMATLGRVLLAQGRHPEANQWFDAALARNPLAGDAAYFKAVSLMNATPPDLSAATRAARQARTAGFTAAEALLREIAQRAGAV